MNKKLGRLVQRSWKKLEPLWHALAKLFGSRWVIVGVSVLLGLMVVGLVSWATYGRPVPLLDTAGTIAHQQRDLIYLTIILGVIVLVPVYILLFTFAWKYRAGNKNAKYDPEYHDDRRLEFLWWTIPFIIILILSVVTYITSHSLDPFKRLESDKEPVYVQVVALQWKWLFIYPDHGIATVNYLNIPENTPINFDLASDAPMNSFWIPALSGQIYTMNGMRTKLSIMADKPGTYFGTSANISGEGHADMQFDVNVQTENDFHHWVHMSAMSNNLLTNEEYEALAQPSRNIPDKTYTLAVPTLFDDVIMKYMGHSGHAEGMH